MLVGTPSCRPRAFHSESGTPGNKLWGCSDVPGLSAIHVMVAGSVRAGAFSPFCAQEASIARHAAQVSKIFFMVFVVWICMRRMGGGYGAVERSPAASTDVAKLQTFFVSPLVTGFLLFDFGLDVEERCDAIPFIHHHCCQVNIFWTTTRG